MSESNGRCEFEHLDYCCPPEWLVKSGYHCSKASSIQDGDVAEKCSATDADLMTEEEWELRQAGEL